MKNINNVQWLIFLQIYTCFTFACLRIFFYFSIYYYWRHPHNRTVTINNIFSLHLFDDSVLIALSWIHTLMSSWLFFFVFTLRWIRCGCRRCLLANWFTFQFCYFSLHNKRETNINKWRINYRHRLHKPPKFQKSWIKLAWLDRKIDWFWMSVQCALCVCVSANVYLFDAVVKTLNYFRVSNCCRSTGRRFFVFSNSLI